jgi:hypothetical protein
MIRTDPPRGVIRSSGRIAIGVLKGCRRPEVGKVDRGVVGLFLAVPDPATHPALLASHLPTTLPSATTGHTHSSRMLRNGGDRPRSRVRTESFGSYPTFKTRSSDLLGEPPQKTRLTSIVRDRTWRMLTGPTRSYPSSRPPTTSRGQASANGFPCGPDLEPRPRDRAVRRGRDPAAQGSFAAIRQGRFPCL